MRTVTISVALLVTLSLSSLFAQRGEPMMVCMDGGGLMQGVILAIDDSMLYVDFSGQRWDAVATPSHVSVSVLVLDSVDFVMQRKQSRTGSGALTGLLVGAGAGALLGWISYEKPKPGFFVIDPGPDGMATIGGLVGGLIGVVVGSIAGAASPITEKYFDPRTEDGYKQILEIAIFGNKLPLALRSALDRTIAVSR